MDDNFGPDFGDLIEELARKIAVPEGHVVVPEAELQKPSSYSRGAIQNKIPTNSRVKQVLLLAIAQEWGKVKSSYVWAWHREFPETVQLSTSLNEIVSLGFDSRQGRVYKIEKQKTKYAIEELVAGRGTAVSSNSSKKITCDNGRAYVLKDHKTLVRVLDGKKVKAFDGFYGSDVILCRKGFGYYAARYSDIEKIPEMLVSKRDSEVTALVVHNGVMYDAAGKCVYKTLEGVKIAEFDFQVNDLCSFEGTLLAVGKSAVDVLSNQTILTFQKDKKNCFTAAAAIPTWGFEKLLRLTGKYDEALMPKRGFFKRMADDWNLDMKREA